MMIDRFLEKKVWLVNKKNKIRGEGEIPRKLHVYAFSTRTWISCQVQKKQTAGTDKKKTNSPSPEWWAEPSTSGVMACERPSGGLDRRGSRTGGCQLKQRVQGPTPPPPPPHPPPCRTSCCPHGSVTHTQPTQRGQAHLQLPQAGWEDLKGPFLSRFKISSSILFEYIYLRNRVDCNWKPKHE